MKELLEVIKDLKEVCNSLEQVRARLLNPGVNLTDFVHSPLHPIFRIGDFAHPATTLTGLVQKAYQVNYAGVADFAGKVIRDKMFSGQNMAGAVFTDADVTRANFSHCNLTGASFMGATVKGAKFNGAVLDGASFIGVNQNDLDLSLARSTKGIKLDPYEICPDEGSFYAYKATTKGVVKVTVASYSNRATIFRTRKILVSDISIERADPSSYSLHSPLKYHYTPGVHISDFAYEVGVPHGRGFTVYITREEAEAEFRNWREKDGFSAGNN